MRHDSLGTGLLWIGPWLLGFLFFTVVPVSLALYYGFTDYTLLEAPIPVGTQNYERMFDDEILGTVLWNTAVFGVLSIVLGTIVSISLAALLSKPARFQSFWRAAVFAPSVLGAPRAAVRPSPGPRGPRGSHTTGAAEGAAVVVTAGMALAAVVVAAGVMMPESNRG